MSHPDISDEYLAPFRAIAKDSHLTILLGAGASVPSGLPSWEELAVILAVRSKLVDDVQGAHLLLSAPGQDLSFVMQAVRANAGEEWLDFLIEALEDKTGPSELHFAAVAHYLHDSSRTTLATLNFDVLLERAAWAELLDSGEEEPRVSIFEEEVSASHGVGIYHLHGHAFHRSVGDVVAGFDDYMTLMTAESPWQKDFLEGALRRGSLLLAGTSYNDPDIRYWLHQALKNGKNRENAIVVIAREGMKGAGTDISISKESFEGIKNALTVEWQSIGIRPIFVSDYSDVAQIVTELRKLEEVGYQSPQNVARSLLEAHVKSLHLHQPKYEERLARNALELKRKLKDAPIHRPTLWLADGEGFLVRWASKGGHYTDLSEMKRIPTGHDSGWIAGEALSSTGFRTKAVAIEKKSRPAWKSIIAIPVQVRQVNLAVVTFGVDRKEDFLKEKYELWREVAEEMAQEWGNVLEGALGRTDVLR